MLTWGLPGIAIYYSVEQAFYGLQLVFLCRIVHVLEVEVYYSCKRGLKCLQVNNVFKKLLRLKNDQISGKILYLVNTLYQHFDTSAKQ